MPTWKKALFAALVLVLLLGAAEGLARLLGPGLLPPDHSRDAAPGQPVPGEPEMLGDAATGWRIKPGPNRLFGVPGGSFVNELGIRGPALSAKAPGERRVLLLGDSSVYGVMVRDEETFGARTQTLLGGDTLVLNAGCPGYSSWQALRALRERLLPAQPDVVVVATLWSDTQGADQPDSARFGHDPRPLLSHSHAYLLARDWLLTLRWGAPHPPVQAGQPERVGFGLSQPLTPAYRVPLSQYRDNLRAIAQVASDHDARTVFLMLPCVRDPDGGGVGDFRDGYRGAMRQVAAELDAPLVDTPPAFLGGDARALFFDEVHPTSAGHAIIAHELARALGQ